MKTVKNVVIVAALAGQLAFDVVAIGRLGFQTERIDGLADQVSRAWSKIEPGNPAAALSDDELLQIATAGRQ